MNKITRSMIPGKIRLSFILHLLAVLSILWGFFPACRPGSSPQPRLLVVFTDMSASIPANERALYEAYMDTIISTLQSGDRLVVAKISDGTMIRFSPIFARTLPQYSFWMDNPLTHKRQLDKIRTEVRQKTSKALKSSERSPRTEIIMSFLVSEEEFRNWTGRKRLVLLSDMLECSTDLNFEVQPLNLTPPVIEAAIQRLRDKNRIPRLDSVSVWVAGATAQNSDDFLAVKAFWERYIRETGAILEHYSHDIGQFE